MELPTYIKASPTSMKLLEMYPEGSVVDRELIVNSYILLSPSMYRQKRFGKGPHSKYRSIPASRKIRGIKLYKKMVNEGFWKTQ
jgi:hypothetical protein